jgi:acid phosphatase family membrane protein YuiD
MQKYELLLAPAVAWILAQGIKYVLFLRKDGFQFADLFASGGFPSSHTAGIIAPAVLIGLREGLDDPLFAVITIIACLVMYDAIGVRRSSGEQALAIKELASKTGKTLTTRIHGAKGHTPTEVAGGFALGVAVGFVFYLVG